ncbi:MAG: HIT domain-containing protein [Chloroflexota bacterium]|nr:HIT domain-containing protein [Chloroflexota bacterium]
MQRLWSPWRAQYVGDAEPVPEGCIFCRLPEEQNDRANLVAWRGEHTFVVLNRYPYNTGHLMVVPHKHAAELDALPPETLLEMMTTMTRCIAALGEAYGPDGYNAGMNLGSVAGAGIADHLHLHIVPRWAGDTNFMPVLADVKVMPELLEQSYEKIATALGQQDDAAL